MADTYREELAVLWDRLSVPRSEREAFNKKYTGCHGLTMEKVRLVFLMVKGSLAAHLTCSRTKLEEELNRMQKLRKANLKTFIMQARKELVSRFLFCAEIRAVW